MTVISNSVEIRCTPVEAFDYLSDHRNELEWNPGIESIDKLTDGPVGLGTKYLAKWKSAPEAVEVETIAYDRPHGAGRSTTAAPSRSPSPSGSSPPRKARCCSPTSTPGRTAGSGSSSRCSS